MTGVIKSNRCGTCRKRKVKCDEAKPVCTPCRKGNRICEEPISKVKFTKPRESAASTAHRQDGRHRVHGVFSPSTEISVLKSTSTQDGGSFQTMRIGRLRKLPEKPDEDDRSELLALTRRPALSDIETLQLVLIESFSCWTPGLRLSSLVGYVKEIPSRLGYSPALDDAIACLINAHGAICRGVPPGKDPRQCNLYAKALFSLQAALKDPVRCYSDNTLAAVTLLGQTEMFGGGAQGTWPKYIQHAGGASRLMQTLGPENFHTTFAKMLLVNQRGPSMVVAIVRDEDCFLNTPAWSEVSFSELCETTEDMLVFSLEQSVVSLPSVVKKIRKFYSSPSEADRVSILRDVQNIRRMLVEIAEYTTSCLLNGVDVIEVPSIEGDEMVPTVYNFASRHVADLCVFYWGISIVLDTITARFLPANMSPSVIETLHSRCIRHRQRILMSYEYCEQFRPLGAVFMSGPLIMAYYGATPEEREWIMHRLWRIGELIPHCKYFWGPLGLRVCSGYFYGEPLVTPQSLGNTGTPFDDAWENNLRNLVEHFSSLDPYMDENYAEFVENYLEERRVGLE